MALLPTRADIEITEKQLESFWGRFWNQVNKQENCWLWTGAKTRAGYGLLYGAAYKPQVYAHRASFEFHHGPIEGGRLVCHTCDNRACVNPAHLFLGSHKDNTDDMVRKGRQITLSKLSPEKVREIRDAYVPWVVSRRMLADRYGVSVGCIEAIVTRKSWRKLT